MKKFAWVLVFSYTFNGGWTVIDNIASKESCEALKTAIDAPKGKCVQYEIAER